MRHFGVGLIGVLSLWLGCSSDDTSKCIPGQSVACAGPSACQGFQVCSADGATLGACMCGGAAATGTSGASTTGSGVTGSGGNTSVSTTSVGTTSGTTTSGAGGQGGAAAFTPASLTGLSLWLNDDVGVIIDPTHAGTMLKWQDQSGNGNIASAQSLQDGWRYVVDPAAVNGHDAFECPGNGVNMAVNDVASLQFGTGEYAIAMVFKAGIPGGSAQFSAMWDKNLVTFGYNPQIDTELRQGIFTVASSQVDTVKFHYAIARGPALRIVSDTGSSSGAAATGDVSAPGQPVALFRTSASGQEIAEVVAVKGALSDDETAKLQQYFKTKFNLN